jgi:hypothetical protein
MEITNEWLEQWKTPGGGYTRKQLELLGVSWPPAKGWKKSVVGAELADETAKSFEVSSGRQI